MADLPRALTVYTENFDAGVRKVIDLLLHRDGTPERKTKSFFFHGWDGMAASAVLRAIANILKSTSDSDTRKHFGKVIHVDCSLWKNIRVMQREIVKELNLEHLMPIFIKEDEEDDFWGIEDSSRAEITRIGNVIHEHLLNEAFLMIFHYGGDSDIDPADCGIPEVGRFSKGMLVWTNHGRFQVAPRGANKLMSSSIAIEMRFYIDISEPWNECYPPLVHKEAVEVASYTGMDINEATILNCFLYGLFLGHGVYIERYYRWTENVDYDWATHARNYWICSGIIQGNRSWEVGTALYGVLPQASSSIEVIDWADYFRERTKSHKEWISIICDDSGVQNISVIPADASTFLLTFQGPDVLELQNEWFHLATNLRVLNLCKCSFDFLSPPFLCCGNLRFLWLERCKNTGMTQQQEEEEEEEQIGRACFTNLWVLDMRYTDFVLFPEMIHGMNSLREVNSKGSSWRNISRAWSELQDLQRLRLTESPDVITAADCCPPADMMSLELLDFSGNTYMESLPVLPPTGCLKMLVLDGCSSLKQVDLAGAPPLLEYFSFDGYGPTETPTVHPIKLPEKKSRPKIIVARMKAKVTKISLENCTRLHDVFLRGLADLEELNLSCTAVKTVDLEMDLPNLKKVLLLHCEQLRCLKCDSYHVLQVLHVDTRGGKETTTMQTSVCTQVGGSFHAHITLTDARFLCSGIRSISQLTSYADYERKSGYANVHVHISSVVHSHVDHNKNIIVPAGGSKQIHMFQAGAGRGQPYRDIVLAMDIVRPALLWDSQQLKPSKVHLEIGQGGQNLESLQDHYGFRYLTNFRCESLHVHDNSSIRSIPPSIPQQRSSLQWCHVESCPKLHTLFTCDGHPYKNFVSLKIFSACHLQTAHCIWSMHTGYYGDDVRSNFGSLQHLYLHSCPRLAFVLPIYFDLPSLETLQIAYCSNLKHVFPLHDKYPKTIADGVAFKNLKHIKFYHLHKLEQICEARLSAPALEKISLRDCWGLKRLPAVAPRDDDDGKPVVDCEKDWWEKLDWDGLEKNHHPSLFKTHHPAYYKKTTLRTTVLR